MTDLVRVEDVGAGDVVVLCRGGRSCEVLVSAGFDGVGLVGRVRHRDGWSHQGRLFPVRAGLVVRRVGRGGCPLTFRQLEVLGLWASGEVSSAKEIARRLGIDVKTVHNHVVFASRTLGTSGTVQTVLTAVRYGWVEVPPLEGDRAA